MTRPSFCLLAALTLLCAPTLAQRGASACLAGKETALVAGVTGALDLLLGDGRVIRLAGLERLSETPAAGTLAERARLEHWLVEKEVSLTPLSPKPDRWGRTPAHVFASPAPGEQPLSVAEAIADAGMARVFPIGEGRPCLAALLRAEDRARKSRSGLWADPATAVIDPHDTKALKAQAGAFVIIEGRVSRVGEGRQRFYIDFSGAWGGFSASVIKRNALAFDSAGRPLKSLIGRQIRIRGILETRFRPEIEITTPEEIEFIESSDESVNNSPPVK